MGATWMKGVTKQKGLKRQRCCSYKVSTWDCKLSFLCFLLVFEVFRNGKYTFKLSKEPHEKHTLISVSQMKKMKHR